MVIMKIIIVVNKNRINSDSNRRSSRRAGPAARSEYDRPAEFILLVEKDAAFQRLAEDRFFNTYPCVIITGKGEADLATRQATPQSLQLHAIAIAIACNNCHYYSTRQATP